MKVKQAKVAGASSSRSGKREQDAPATFNPTLTPKLRFPEFRDAMGWEECELRTIADPVSDRADNKDDNNILTLSAEQGLVLQSEYFGKQIAGTNAERYLRIQQDDFVYNDRVTKASAYGTIKRLKKHPHGIVSPIYKCFRFKDGELPSFWEWYFEAGAHEAQLRSLANEGARAGRFNVSIDRFLATSVWAPTSDSAEQHKIASCLSSLDDLIAAESQKLDALKTHKQGLMQQLFPREGETRPRLRFPEFRNAGEWKEEKLGGVGDVLMCKRIFASETNDVSGVPFYKIGTLGGKPDAYIDKDLFDDYRSRYKYPRVGEVLITCSGTVGKCLPYDGRDAYYQDSNIVWIDNPTQAVSNEFLVRILTNVNWGKLNSTTITRIYGPDLKGLLIRFPKDHAEQHRIASCLSSLDDLITAQSDKLETLKTHKKGLMQQLFPAPEEVGA